MVCSVAMKANEYHNYCKEVNKSRFINYYRSSRKPSILCRSRPNQPHGRKFTTALHFVIWLVSSIAPYCNIHSQPAMFYQQQATLIGWECHLWWVGHETVWSNMAHSNEACLLHSVYFTYVNLLYFQSQTLCIHNLTKTSTLAASAVILNVQ